MKVTFRWLDYKDDKNVWSELVFDIWGVRKTLCLGRVKWFVFSGHRTEMSLRAVAQSRKCFGQLL